MRRNNSATLRSHKAPMIAIIATYWLWKDVIFIFLCDRNQKNVLKRDNRHCMCNCIQRHNSQSAWLQNWLLNFDVTIVYIKFQYHLKSLQCLCITAVRPRLLAIVRLAIEHWSCLIGYMYMWLEFKVWFLAIYGACLLILYIYFITVFTLLPAVEDHHPYRQERHSHVDLSRHQPAQKGAKKKPR